MTDVPFTRPPGGGWLALLGGGEITFGETFDADQAWLEKAPEGAIGFLPAAAGSVDYATQFAAYVKEGFAREVETVPVFRARDGRRGKNADRVRELAAIYVGGGAPDHLLEALVATPVEAALRERLGAGGVVAAIAGAAQCFGAVVRSVFGGNLVPGLGWLAGGVVEPNFDPDHDRRLRQLLQQPGVRWAVGLPPGAALLLGPDGAYEVVDQVYLLTTPTGDYTLLEEEDDGNDVM